MHLQSLSPHGRSVRIAARRPRPAVERLEHRQLLAADVSVLKTALASTINSGDVAGFSIAVTNNGPDPAFNVLLVDVLPPGAVWSAPPIPGVNIAGGVLTGSFPILPPGATIPVFVTGPTLPGFGGVLVNTATVAAVGDETPGNNDSTATIIVNAPDLVVSKTALADTINTGDTAGFTIMVSNAGEGIAYDVSVTDTLPAGVAWTLNSPPPGVSIVGNTLSGNLGPLPPGASVSILVSGVTDASAAGTLSNTATVSASNESATSNNSATASITVNAPDLTLSKVADQGTVNAGDLAGYTIVVSNVGVGTAYNVTLTDLLPAGVNWSVDPAVSGVSISGGTLIGSFATLPGGAAIPIHVSGVTDAADAGTITNTATVAATNEPAGQTSNNAATANILVVAQGSIAGRVFCDASGDGTDNGGTEPGLAGWTVQLDRNADGTVDATTTSGADGSYSFGALTAGTYRVREVLPAGWTRTTPDPADILVSAGVNVTGVNFGNVQIGSSGDGKGMGFWTNRNGKAVMNDGGSVSPELQLLRDLNLRTSSGGNFEPTTYDQFADWLRRANASNMAYMLSAQLATLALNVEAGFISSTAVVYAPKLLPFAPIAGLSSQGFISVSALMSAANAELGAHGNTTAGGSFRGFQEALKSVIEQANDSKSFILC